LTRFPDRSIFAAASFIQQQKLSGQALYTIRLAWRTVSGTPLLLACGTGCPIPLSPFPMPGAFQRQAFCQISLEPGGFTATARRPSTGRLALPISNF